MRVQLLPNLEESTFREMHEKDEMAVDKLGGGIDGFKDAQVCFTFVSCGAMFGWTGRLL